MTLLGALRAITRAGSDVRIDKTVQEETLRLCLSSHAANRRTANRPRKRREDPGRIHAEIAYGNLGLLGFMPAGWGRD